MSRLQERLHHPFTLEMEQTLSSWLLNHYRMHFSLPLIKAVFQAIPQVASIAVCCGYTHLEGSLFTSVATVAGKHLGRP